MQNTGNSSMRSMGPSGHTLSRTRILCWLVAGLWTVCVVIVLVQYGLQARDSMPLHFTYFGTVLILGTSLVVPWGVFWAKTRSVRAARVLCLCLVLTVITILDCLLGQYSGEAFERVIASDWRYRIYVKGWLRSKTLQERVFRHHKSDASAGP